MPGVGVSSCASSSGSTVSSASNSGNSIRQAMGERTPVAGLCHQRRGVRRLPDPGASVKGRRGRRAVRGEGYLELTGYGGSLDPVLR